MAAGFTTGAVLGGVLTDVLSWRWAFFINVVVAVAVLVVAPKVLDESRPARRPRLDVGGALSVTGALLAIVFGLTHAETTSWTEPATLGALIGGIVLLAVFVAVEQRTAEPLVPMRILRHRAVAVANFAGVLAFATETSLVFLLTLYLQRVLGYSPLLAGLSFAVLGAGTVVGGMLGPKVLVAVGRRGAIVGGLVVQAAATLPLALLGESDSWMVLLLVATFVGGVANLVAIVGFMVTATHALPDHEQGVATGLASMSQQVGITLGIPIMSTIVAARVDALGGATPAHILSGVTTAIAVNAAAAFAVAGVVAYALRPAD
jgi:predicted MFS family arabinose efflux permease